MFSGMVQLKRDRLQRRSMGAVKSAQPFPARPELYSYSSISPVSTLTQTI